MFFMRILRRAGIGRGAFPLFSSEENSTQRSVWRV